MTYMKCIPTPTGRDIEAQGKFAQRMQPWVARETSPTSRQSPERARQSNVARIVSPFQGLSLNQDRHRTETQGCDHFVILPWALFSRPVVPCSLSTEH